jgi:hypothetical protein
VLPRWFREWPTWARWLLGAELATIGLGLAIALALLVEGFGSAVLAEVIGGGVTAIFVALGIDALQRRDRQLQAQREAAQELDLVMQRIQALLGGGTSQTIASAKTIVPASYLRAAESLDALQLLRLREMLGVGNSEVGALSQLRGAHAQFLALADAFEEEVRSAVRLHHSTSPAFVDQDLCSVVFAFAIGAGMAELAHWVNYPDPDPERVARAILANPSVAHRLAVPTFAAVSYS